MRKLTVFMIAAGMMISAASITFTSCTKEGPQGEPGKDGTNGQDANETCKLCHAKTVVDSISVEFEMTKHSWGEASFEESGNARCAPCHQHKGFLYVCRNNTPSNFVFEGGLWVNKYSSVATDAIGEITCFTCHNSLHTTYGYQDISSLTTTAPVSLTMWGGAKTVDIAQDEGISNLCIKCHQPRPMTCAYGKPSGRLLSYDTVKNYPDMMVYDSTTGAVNNFVRPTYRLDDHYGVAGTIFAGTGAIEYPGTLAYGNSAHTTVATCQDCHMATPMTGVAGGHSFNVRNSLESALSASTTWNFNGCNQANCHQNDPITTTSAKWVNTRTTVKAKLDALAAKINAAGGGHDILHKESDPLSNLWAGISTNNYDGYLDVYSSSSNPDGYWRDPANTSPTNMAKPKFPSLKMVQLGAIINFQFCLREYSLGIHNTQYVTALLTNTIDALDDAGL